MLKNRFHFFVGVGCLLITTYAFSSCESSCFCPDNSSASASSQFVASAQQFASSIHQKEITEISNDLDIILALAAKTYQSEYVAMSLLSNIAMEKRREASFISREKNQACLALDQIILETNAKIMSAEMLLGQIVSR